MTNLLQKLELNWLGKDKRPRLEPRILLEDMALSHHARFCRTENDIYDNKLIYGDNLLALKALEQEYTGRVKCVYIDPPFNTQQAFEHYDDGIEHSLWLSLIRDRLEIIHRLMTTDGTLFIHIDDNELAYLTVLTDEIFGRKNRINIVTFKQGSTTGHKAINPGLVSTSNFILIYAKDKVNWKPNRVFTTRVERDKRYSQFIENISAPCSEWRFCSLMRAFSAAKGIPEKTLKKNLGKNFETEITAFVHENANAVIRLARPEYDAVSAAAREMIDQSKTLRGQVMILERPGLSDMYFVGGERIIFYANKLKMIDGQYVDGEPLTNIWDDILSNNLHNEGGVEFPKGKKPESLIKRCIELSTAPGDIVLDSFAGSGTTGAVAHKMRRRWIMIELREQARTHIQPRLQQVIDGDDQGGISKAVGWTGGGGFRYYQLAPSLLIEDAHGFSVINPEYNPVMLAEAMCKLMGFRYEPSDTFYWQHGQSNENAYIYITTRLLDRAALALISADVGPDRSLVICCPGWRGKADQFDNLVLHKIPKAVLSRCEWGHDDYSLNIKNLPLLKPEPESEQPAKAAPKAADMPLFGE